MSEATTIPESKRSSRRVPSASWFNRIRHDDLARAVLFAANDRQIAYLAHLILAALFFSPFLLFGNILAANTDLLTHNYPMLLLAKREFLHGTLGLWNPYTFSGAPEAVAAATPILFPENWLLFLVPEQFFFPTLTFFAFLKLWFVGIAAYRFFCAELLNRRWALFASITYQLSGWAIWAVCAYVALSIFLYYTILLALIWTMGRRGNLQNYVLLSIVTTMMLLAGNLAQTSYALLSIGILLLYRAFTYGTGQSLTRAVIVFSASSATALLIFCVRLLPILDAFSSGVRQEGCCEPYFKNASFLILRLFDSELFGVNYHESQISFPAISKLFEDFHLHLMMPSFFGVIAALLVVWAVVSIKSQKSGFWSIYTTIIVGLIAFVQPFDALWRALMSPIYHPLSLHAVLPVGFASLAAIGGASLERTLRHGRVSRLTTEFFVAGIAFVALFILVVGIRNIDGLSKIGSNEARATVAGLLVASIALALVWRTHPQCIRALLLPALYGVAAVGISIVIFVGSNNPTFLSHLKNIGSQVSVFAVIAIVLVQAGRGDLGKARQLGVWAGGFLLVLCLIVNLYPWTRALLLSLTNGQSHVLAGLGALRFALGVAVFALAVSYAGASKLPARSVYLVFLVVLLGEQVPAAKVHSHLNANPFYDADTLYPPMAKLSGTDGRPIQLDLQNYRVNFPNTMLKLPFYNEIWGASHEIAASINVAYGVRSYGGYNNTIPFYTNRFLQNWNPEETNDIVIYAKLSDPRFLDMSGVGYEYDPNSGTVASRPGARSRIMLFTQFEVIDNQDAVLSRLKEPAFRPLERTILQEGPGFQSRSSDLNGRKLQFSEITPDRIEVRVEGDGPSLLAFNDAYNVGWTVRINGEPRALLRSDYNFMAVALPAGINQIVLTYRPRSFLLGAALAGAGIFALALVSALWLFRHRSREAESEESRIRAGTSHARYRSLRRVVMIVLALSAFQIVFAPVKAVFKPIVDGSRAEFSVKVIEEGYGGRFNILQIGPDKFVALAQSEGSFAPEKLAAGGYKEVYVGKSADDVKAKIPDKDQPVSVVEEGYRGFNILQIGAHKFVALAQGEGGFSVEKLEAGGYKEVYVGSSVEEVKAKIPAKEFQIMLIEEGYRGFNILQIGPEKFIALKQSDGAFSPDKLAAGEYMQYYLGTSVDDVKSKVPRGR